MTPAVTPGPLFRLVFHKGVGANFLLLCGSKSID